MASLVPAHGGLTEPVDLHRPCRRGGGVQGRSREAAEGARLGRRPVDRLSLRRRRALAAHRPDGRRHVRTGARRGGHRAQRQALRLDDSALASGHRRAGARRSRRARRSRSTNAAGEVVATLDISDVFAWDKPQLPQERLRTERTDHPGADMVLKGDADKTHLIGGTIRVLPQPKNPKFGKYVLSPREVRKLLAEQGLEARRRVPDPQPAAPRPRVRPGLRPRDAAPRRATTPAPCLNPLIGETKGDDVNADIRMQTYEALIDQRALGEGDSDADAVGAARRESVPDRVILLGLDIKMFYGGPKEAVMHGIYRQNYRLHRHRHRPQARRRALPRRHGHLGRLRRPGDLRQARAAT